MFELYEFEDKDFVNKEIQKTINSINKIYKKIDDSLYSQQKFVKKRTDKINIFHHVPYRTINDIINDIDSKNPTLKDIIKDIRCKNPSIKCDVLNSNKTYLDLFPKTEAAKCFSSMIKSGLKGNCEGRTVMSDLYIYQGYTNRAGFMKKIFDKNDEIEKVTKELESNLRHLFIEKHSLANLSNKFFKLNINMRKSISNKKIVVPPLNDDVINLILEYLPGYYISKNLNVCLDFYKDNVYDLICKKIDSLYDTNFVSHIENSLILDDNDIKKLQDKRKT